MANFYRHTLDEFDPLKPFPHLVLYDNFASWHALNKPLLHHA